MGTDTLGNKLLQDIDIAYDEAIKSRVLNIQEAVNEIVNDFKVKKHSLMGIANLDALNDYSQIPTSEMGTCEKDKRADKIQLSNAAIEKMCFIFFLHQNYSSSFSHSENLEIGQFCEEFGR